MSLADADLVELTGKQQRAGGVLPTQPRASPEIASTRKQV